MLERLAVYASIMVGIGEGIAVVLAVKGLARYPELKATTSGAPSGSSSAPSPASFSPRPERDSPGG